MTVEEEEAEGDERRVSGGACVEPEEGGCERARGADHEGARDRGERKQHGIGENEREERGVGCAGDDEVWPERWDEREGDPEGDDACGFEDEVGDGEGACCVAGLVVSGVHGGGVYFGRERVGTLDTAMRDAGGPASSGSMWVGRCMLQEVCWVRARMTLRGLVPLESDGSDVVGITVVPWAELEPVDEPSAAMRVRFVWMDEHGRVVRRRELGGRGVFEVVTPASRGKGRKGKWAKRRVVPRLVWMRALKRAARDESLVVVRDQRGAWWLEVLAWIAAMAGGAAFTSWFVRSEVWPVVEAGESPHLALAIVLGLVSLCGPAAVLMLMWPRRDVLRGRVARWSRIDASGIRAGWSPERTEHFSWEEVADASVFGLRPNRIVTSAGREVMLSISARGLEWINQRIWVPRLEAMEAEAAEREEEEVPPEGEAQEGEPADSHVAPSEEALEAMAAERRAFEIRGRRRTVIVCLCVGLIVGALMALLAHGERGGSLAWTLGAGVSGFAMGSLMLPLVFGVLWIVGSLERLMRARKDRGFSFVPARITLAGLVPERPEDAGGVRIAPWVELWRGPRGYEWRDADGRWAVQGTRQRRTVLTLDPSSERTHAFEEGCCHQRLLTRAARHGKLRVVIDQRGLWSAEAGVLGIEVVVPTLCAAAMVATFGGPMESWGVVGWLVVGATAVGAAGLTARDWRELWRSPVRVRADSTGLVLRMVTGRARRVAWAEVRDVRRAGDMRITTASGRPFCTVLNPRMDALLDAKVQGRVRHEPEREPFNLRNVLRFAMFIGLVIGVIGIYAMVSNGKPVFPGAVHAGMFCGGMVLAVCGLMLGAKRLKPHVI